MDNVEIIFLHLGVCRDDASGYTGIMYWKLHFFEEPWDCPAIHSNSPLRHVCLTTLRASSRGVGPSLYPSHSGIWSLLRVCRG